MRAKPRVLPGRGILQLCRSKLSGQFNDFDSFITLNAFREEVTESFAAWENTADIRFQLVPDSAEVDIRLGWGDIDGSGGVLGQAIVPSSGALSKVIVLFDVRMKTGS